MTHGQEQALSRGIANPNSSGQGIHPEAAYVPLRWRIERLGWRYSHTTRVVVDQTSDRLETLAGGSLQVVHDVTRDELRHTFLKEDHYLSVWKDLRHQCWRWPAHRGGSPCRASGLLLEQADTKYCVLRYLKRVAYRQRKKVLLETKGTP